MAAVSRFIVKRGVDEKRVVQDGPFADSKEQLGGYLVIEVADLDAALEWAAKAPGRRYGHGVFATTGTKVTRVAKLSRACNWRCRDQAQKPSLRTSTMRSPGSTS